MQFQPKMGVWLLTVCAVGAIANFWASRAFPTKWGGPNIGGGLLQIVFYVGILVGGVVIARSLMDTQRRRRRGER